MVYFFLRSEYFSGTVINLDKIDLDLLQRCFLL